MSRVKILLYLLTGVFLLILVNYFYTEEITADTDVQEEEIITIVDNRPTVEQIDPLFSLHPPQLPIVETITYKSHVPWKKGGAAWLSDYAKHFKTSRHFIARSLNGKPDYLKQDLKEGDRFNILRTDKNIEFYLVLETNHLTLYLYYLDLDKNHSGFIKSYPVSLGREDTTKESGFLTPLGQYSLGDRIAIYEPKTMGYYQGTKTEMIQIFGTRWIPFEKEIKGCTAPAKSFGIHGVPWIENAESKELIEDTTSIGKYESDGCIRLKTDDIEELYAIIISRPTKIEIVKNFNEATVPGEELVCQY